VAGGAGGEGLAGEGGLALVPESLRVSAGELVGFMSLLS